MKTISVLGSLLSFLFFSITMQAQVNWDDFNDIKSSLSTNRGGPGGDGGGLGGDGGSGSGGGESALKVGINVDWADKGKMLAKDSYIHWQTIDASDAGPYKIVVRSENNGKDKTVFVDHTHDNGIKVPMNNLKSGENYSVQIISASKKLSSKKAKFEIVEKDVYWDAINSAKMQEDFGTGDRLNKILMKAFALQSNGLNHEAYKKYKMYVESDAENNKLRNMRDLFRKSVKISCLCK